MIHIKNAQICDGTGREPYPGEVLIEGERIRAVSPVPLGALDAKTIDAGGKLVTPGFIDAHRHCDLAALYDPGFGEAELTQGITTAVMGNCGLAPAPCVPEHQNELYNFLEPCLGAAPESSLFPRVSDFFRALEAKRHPINLGLLGATGAITVAAKGFHNQPFSHESRSKAERYVRDAMEAGALGLSCGMMYTPECWSTADDFVFLARICGEYGGYLTSHIRGEGASLKGSVQEVLEIGRRAHLPVNISHFKVTGLQNHGTGIEQAIAVLEHARASGQDVTADAYPYTGGSTTLLSLIPPTVLAKAGDDLPGYLGSAGGRRVLAEEIGKDFSDWDNMVSSIGWERILISSVAGERYRGLAGRDFAAAAASLSLSEPELLCELACTSGGKVGIIVMSMAQADVDRVLGLPWVCLISDALYGGGDFPHPRLYGSFPKFLREYVREKKLLTLGQAVYKMTGLPARRLGLGDRGILAPGKQADLLLFDPAAFTDRASWQSPKQLATGLELVLVNGAAPRELRGKILKK